MPDWSRRRALRTVATAGSLALAGCSGESSRSNDPPPERGEPVPDLEVRFVRDTDGGSPFDTDDESASTSTDDPDAVTHSFEYLTDRDEFDDLTFPSTTPAAELRSFVDATDFEAESVYLLERAIGECYRANLVAVYRESDGVDVDFCEALRPADVDCSAEAEDAVGVAIRLPFPGEEFNSLGSGWSGDCDRRPIVAREGGDGG